MRVRQLKGDRGNAQNRAWPLLGIQEMSAASVLSSADTVVTTAASREGPGT